jgi:hypothetical protein
VFKFYSVAAAALAHVSAVAAATEAIRNKVQQEEGATGMVVVCQSCYESAAAAVLGNVL